MNKLKALYNSPVGKVVAEALRWGVLAFASTVVAYLLDALPKVDVPANTVTYLTIFLRFVDAALHKSGVAERGLTRF